MDRKKVQIAKRHIRNEKPNKEVFLHLNNPSTTCGGSPSLYAREAFIPAFLRSELFLHPAYCIILSIMHTGTAMQIATNERYKNVIKKLVNNILIISL